MAIASRSSTSLLALALASTGACVATGDDVPARTGPDRADIEVGLELDLAVDVPGDRASCAAAIFRSELPAGTCTARLEVRFECDVTRPQVHTWARVGVVSDTEVLLLEDLAYQCGWGLTRELAVPCEAALVGGATFDHPRSAGDITCLAYLE